MKKDLIPAPMLPFTAEEEEALTLKLQALSAPALVQYVEAAQNALRNSALAPTWRPRVELGLSIAQKALASANAAAAAVPPVAA